MTRRILVLSASFTLLFAISLGLAPTSVFAQASDQLQPDVDNSKFQFAGVVNTDSVYVRSGPSENYYPTLKLEKGSGVTVVGIRFDWLKILPPDGSFCYVAKAYVEKRGDGSVGRVSTPLNVRAGSALNAMKTTVLAKLNEGDDVQILGEEDEYFKIKPPTGTYFYVNKQFVDPVKALAPDNSAGATPVAGAGPTPSGSISDANATPAPNFTNSPDASGATAGAPAPSAGSAPDPSASATTEPSVADGATSQPSVADATTQPTQQQAEAKFDDLEARYAQASGQTLDAQPISDLLAGYSDLDAVQTLPGSLHQIVSLRLQTLNIRAKAQTELLAARKAQQDETTRETAMKAEKDELEQRIKATEIVSYAAVGTLQPSSLQVGTPTLYRLTDPETGRTVIYLRSDDAKLVTMIGQFIGVRGPASDDSQMGIRSIAPTDFEVVDPSKVNSSIMADLIPPSLAPKVTASASPQ